ncbi:hypothetical protein H4S04_007102 [Coemansia sp. S16]|nr:hypothetical protein H4S04_007102 [Coemansia sp. S16]KAJ2350226.1 hypothetical protein GGH92_002357 [Coemansia sp. RSA 2673]KAJ2428600.1 hypothetical protein GGF41_001327 [Coemansia sp. RSA 2531]
MSDVPRNFAWHHFRHDIFNNPIIFLQLTVLRLTFEYESFDITKDEVRDKIALGAHNCDLLYADIPCPELKEVVLSRSISNIRHCSQLKLTRVCDLSVCIFSADLDGTADIYRVTNHLFSNIHIDLGASLSSTSDWFVLDPDVMRWTNLTKLEVDKADYTTVCKAISRLPSISHLILQNLATNSFIEDSSLFTSADSMLAWGAELPMVKISTLDKDCHLMALVSGIQALILRVGALCRLSVPELIIEPVLAFIKTGRGRYYHFENI